MMYDKLITAAKVDYSKLSLKRKRMVNSPNHFKYYVLRRRVRSYLGEINSQNIDKFAIFF